MNLVLSSREQARVAQALYTLASPFEHESVAAWGEGIIAQVESALQHEGCWVQLPVDGKPAAIGVERLLTPSDLARYKAYEPYLASTGAYERSARLGVVTHETAYGPHYEEVMQSTYIHELREAGVYDMMSILVPATDRPSQPQDVAQIYLNTFARQHAFSEQQVQIGYLLHPALKAGMTSFRKLEAVRHRLGALLDASGAACAVFSLGGRLLHRTPALEEALAREPRREDLMERSRSLTSAFAGRRNPLEVPPVPTPFVGARGRYTLVPTRMEGLAPQPVVLVTVTAPAAPPEWPSEEEVRERLDLTRRQAQVALLLARRHANQEIADALAISVNTARHHVEGVLKRTGASRSEVPALVQRLAAEREA